MSSAATVTEPTAAHSSTLESASGLVPMKLGGTALLGRKRSYVTEDE